MKAIKDPKKAALDTIAKVSNDPNLNADSDQTAYLAALAIIILSIFVVNIFTAFFAVLCLVCLNGDRVTYENWKRSVKTFYIVCEIFLVIVVIIFALMVVWGVLSFSLKKILLGVYVAVLSLALIIFVYRAKSYVWTLYTNEYLSIAQNAPAEITPKAEPKEEKKGEAKPKVEEKKNDSKPEVKPVESQAPVSKAPGNAI